MSLRRFLNGVHGIMLDACSDEDERAALEETLTVPPSAEPETAESWAQRIRAAGGEVG